MTRISISAIVAAIALAGCGDVGPGGGSSHAETTHTEGLVLRAETGGGFVPPEVALGEMPFFSLYSDGRGDGRAIVQGPQILIYPPPALPNLLERSVSEEGVQAILAEAEKAGLLGPDRHYDLPGIADAPTTTFTVVADGVTHTTSVYALGAEEAGTTDVPEDELAPRRAIADFSAKLLDLSSWLPEGSVGEEAPFDFTELRTYVSRYEVSPEPGLEQEPRPWPLAEPLAAFGEPEDEVLPDLRCGVVSGEELSILLADAQSSNTLTPWTSEGGRYLLVFRPLLPDEHGC